MGSLRKYVRHLTACRPFGEEPPRRPAIGLLLGLVNRSIDNVMNGNLAGWWQQFWTIYYNQIREIAADLTMEAD